MEPAESAPPSTHPIRDLLLRVYCYLVVIFVLYVLSAGPMYWTIYEAFHVNESRLIQAIYFPLVLLSEFEPIGRILNWYVGLWIF